MQRTVTGWIFAAPALILITLFFVLPIFAALLLSRLLGENKALKDDNDLFV